MAKPLVILARRHGADPKDEPVLIAGPSFDHASMKGQFKRDFCQSGQNPDLAEVWLGQVQPLRRMKLEQPKADAKKADAKKKPAPKTELP
jgi:hypothetical protein